MGHNCVITLLLKTYRIGKLIIFFFSSRRLHTRYWRDWSSDVCSSDLGYPRYIRKDIHPIKLLTTPFVEQFFGNTCEQRDSRSQENGGQLPMRMQGNRRHTHKDEKASCHVKRSEEHTSELQSRQYLVCRLLLEKTKR